MDRTISCKCPQCGYVRYDILHIENCGGLLLKRECGDVICNFCRCDMSFDVMHTCPACGYVRLIDPVSLDEKHSYAILKMEVYESIIIYS